MHDIKDPTCARADALTKAGWGRHVRFPEFIEKTGVEKDSWIRNPGIVTKTGGFSSWTALAGVLFIAAVFSTGFFVGKRFDEGSHAKQEIATAKAVVKDAEQHEAAVNTEVEWMRPFEAYNSQRATVFKQANDEILAKYAAKPRLHKSVTTDIHSTTTGQDHETPQIADRPAADDGVLFDADELRLYNLGNKESDFTGPLHGEAAHPEAVHDGVPDGPA